MVDSWPEIARKKRRLQFASNKTLPRPECQNCEWLSICRQGCPKFRYARYRRFEDLDYFCQSYKMIYSKCVGPLRKEVEKLVARQGGTACACARPGT